MLMKFTPSKVAISIFSALLCVFPSHATPAPLSAEDFSKQPAISSLSMSIEGDMLVGLVTDPTDPDKRAAAYWDLSGDIDTSQPLLPSSITPSGNKTLFFAASALKNKKSLWYTTQPYIGALMGCGEGKTTGATKKYITKVAMGNAGLKKIDDLPDGRTEIGANAMLKRCFELVGETDIAAFLPLDPEHIILSRTTTKSGTRYFKHNLRTGKEIFIGKASDIETYSLSNLNGEITAKTKLEYTDGEWRRFVKLPDQNGNFVIEAPLTVEVKNRYTMNLVYAVEDTSQYYVLTDKFSDKVSLYAYDSQTDTFSSDPVLAHPEFNITSIITSEREQDWGQLLGFRYAGPTIETYWLDPEMQSIQSGLEAAFPERNISLSDWTEDRNRILFRVSAADMPPSYFVLLDKSKVAVIGSERPWIKPEQLGKSDFVYYTARDGMKVPAILTLPAGYTPGMKAKGAIIHPHGGPWARDYAGFDSSGWTQYFANRGYIIMQPQYRGSAGWGRELWLAGDSEWGQKMQDDKDDGAAWLVSQGYVDADKIAIHGYSYGGFAAIAASVRPDGPYQCAIAGAGVANLTRLGNSWGRNRIQRIIQGNTVTGMDPQDNTDKIDIPILLYHGDYDVRVPLWHSEDFYDAIKDKSPESKLMVLEQMGHQSNKWLPEHKAAVLEEMENFLNTTCGI